MKMFTEDEDDTIEEICPDCGVTFECCECDDDDDFMDICPDCGEDWEDCSCEDEEEDD